MQSESTQVAIIGAGPHGLSVAAHLRRAGVECRVIGEPMSFWRGMPQGMLLRSNWTATSIAEHDGPLSLASPCAQLPEAVRMPLPLEDFLAYGEWVRGQVAPDVERCHVESLDVDGDNFVVRLGDGGRVVAQRVVVAAGIGNFVHLPEAAAGWSPDLVSHASDHADLGVFRGRSVLVVGLGQSALESAALLHEAGAEVEVLARRDHMIWLHGGKYHRRARPPGAALLRADRRRPLGLSRVVAAPDLFRRLPPSGAGSPRLPRRSGRRGPRGWAPASARCRSAPEDASPLGACRWSGSPPRSRTAVSSAAADHVICTAPAIGRHRALPLPREPGRGQPAGAHRGLPGRCRWGWSQDDPARPAFRPGAPAAWSLGPTMRFVAGGWFGARSSRVGPRIGGRSAPRRDVGRGMTTKAAPIRADAGRAPKRPTGAVVVGGDYQGLGIARSLGRRGVPVVVLDDEMSIARVSRHVSRFVRVGDLRDEAAALEALIELGTTLSSPGWVLYPTREETVVMVSRNRDLLSRWYRVATPSFDVVRIAWDKRETYRWAQRVGVATPRTWFPANVSELDDIALDGPVIVKPAIKEHFFYTTKAKAWRADDLDELRGAYVRRPPSCRRTRCMVQEVVPGDGHAQFAYGALLPTVPRSQHDRGPAAPAPVGLRSSEHVRDTVDLPEFEALVDPVPVGHRLLRTGRGRVQARRPRRPPAAARRQRAHVGLPHPRGRGRSRLSVPPVPGTGR